MKTFWSNLKLWIFKNWNTTAVGAVIIALLTFAVHKGWMTTDSVDFWLGILASIGFAVSKDGNKTGK